MINAAIALILSVLGAAGAVVALAAGAGVFVGSVSINEETVTAHGAKLFADRCASCHALTRGAPVGFGPSLANIGADAENRKPTLSASEFILESIATPGAHREPGINGHMPVGTLDGVGEQEIRYLLAYLSDFGGKQNKEEITSLTIDTSLMMGERRLFAPLESLRNGERLFSKVLGCNSCHSILGEPGSDLQAPSLARAGLLPSEYLLQSIREPSKVIAAGYQRVIITLNDGVEVSGLMVGESAQNISVLISPNVDPRVRQFAYDDITQVDRELISSMPAYDQLSVEEERTLVAFLRSLIAITSGNEG